MTFAARVGAAAIPVSLVAWELGSVALRNDKRPPKKFPEGSLEWTIERDVSTLDLVLTRRQAWRLGPARGLASLAAPGHFDSVGVIIVDKTGEARVLEADVDGSVFSTSLVKKMQDPCQEMLIRPLAWPRPERDKIENGANLFAMSAMMRCGAKFWPNPIAALSDERFAPLWQPRQAWPRVHSDALLDAKLRHAVSPAASLVLELYADLGLIPPQHKGQPFTVNDFAHHVPLRKGATFGPSVPIKVSNTTTSS